MKSKAVFSKRQGKAGTHILFWVCYVLFFGSVYGKYGNNFHWYFIESLAMLPFIIGATYTTVYGILPWYLRTRRLLLTVLLVLSVLFLATLGERMFLRFINNLPVTLDSIFGVTFLYLFLETNFMVAIVFAIKIVRKWFDQQEHNHLIERKNLEKELSLMKAQLQPHFLFNSMNNLYSLSLTKSAKTSEGISHLAELLQSVLYDCNDSEIPLSKEINLIEHYIELERLRFGEQLNLKFIINGNCEGWNIPPMLLFTFVENCFKHGNPNPAGEFFICLNLTLTTWQLKFVAQNSVGEGSLKSKSDTSGVGLVNAKKRLDIIYGNQYQLNCGVAEKSWVTFLEVHN